MTTILSIATNYGEPAIVLFGDTKVAWYSGEAETHDALESKLIESKNYGLGFAGDVDSSLDSFFKYILGGRGRKAGERFQRFYRFQTDEGVEVSGDMYDLYDILTYVPRKIATTVQDIIARTRMPKNDYEREIFKLSRTQVIKENILTGILNLISEQIAKSCPDLIYTAVQDEQMLSFALLNHGYISGSTAFPDLTDLLLVSNYEDNLKQYKIDIRGIFHGPTAENSLQYVAIGQTTPAIRELLTQERYRSLPGLDDMLSNRLDTESVLKLGRAVIERVAGDTDTVNRLVDRIVVEPTKIHTFKIVPTVRTAIQQSYQTAENQFRQSAREEQDPSSPSTS